MAVNLSIDANKHRKKEENKIFNKDFYTNFLLSYKNLLEKQPCIDLKL